MEATIKEALIDVKNELLRGRDVAETIQIVAEENGLPVVMLTNRAKLAYGDLSTFAERQKTFAAATSAEVVFEAKANRRVEEYCKAYGINVDKKWDVAQLAGSTYTVIGRKSSTRLLVVSHEDGQGYTFDVSYFSKNAKFAK